MNFLNFTCLNFHLIILLFGKLITKIQELIKFAEAIDFKMDIVHWRRVAERQATLRTSAKLQLVCLPNRPIASISYTT